MKDAIRVRRAVAPLGAPYASALIPADDESASRIDRLELGEVAELRIVRERSLPQLRLYRALLSKIAEATEWGDPERLHVALKLKLGRYDIMELRSGKVVPVPHSTAFHKMTAAEFGDYFNKALDVLFDEVLPGVDREGLIREVEDALGLPPLTAEPAL